MDDDEPQVPHRALKKWHERRTWLTDQIVDALLEEGVAMIPLRDLAKRVRVSDRMLLYYFETQAELISEALQRLSERLAIQLADLAPMARMPPARLFKVMIEALAQPSVVRTLRVWSDITARGARNQAPFDKLAQEFVARWLTWTAERLDVNDYAQRAGVAAAILVVVEGARMIEMTTPGATKGVETILARAFEAEAVSDGA